MEKVILIKNCVAYSKNIVNPMGFLLRYKDSVLKHVHTDDTLMVITSELKLYQGNGGDYLGGCLTGFYITKDFLSKRQNSLKAVRLVPLF